MNTNTEKSEWNPPTGPTTCPPSEYGHRTPAQMDCYAYWEDRRIVSMGG